EIRGIRTGRLRAVPALAVPVLEAGMEAALTLAESMDARGHGCGRRTRYRSERWDAPSIAIALVAFVCALAFGVALQLRGGGLEPSTFPLHLPSVSLALVGAASGFALPGFLPRGKHR